MNDATSQEPSMEEILASIRRIISEEGEGRPEQRMAPPPPAAAPSASSPTARSASQSGPQSAQQPSAMPPSTPAPSPGRDDDVLELTQPAGGPAPQQARTAPAAFKEGAPREAAPKKSGDLLSSSAATAAASAFAALSGGSVEEPVMQSLSLGDGTRTLEDIVREMLRPLLKDWLDQNLPSLVERMVRAEIERLSRFR